jgi:hypothetical protein
MKLDTDSIAEHLPIFKEKLKHGQNKDLRIIMRFDDIKLLFGQLDTDVVIQYILEI